MADLRVSGPPGRIVTALIGWVAVLVLLVTGGGSAVAADEAGPTPAAAAPVALGDGAMIDDPACRANVVAPGTDQAVVDLGFEIAPYGSTSPISTVVIRESGRVELGNSGTVWVLGQLTDTTSPGTQPVSYGLTTFAGHPTLCVAWYDVGAWSPAGFDGRLNRMQLLLIRSGTPQAPGFDLMFNFDQVEWDTVDGLTPVVTSSRFPRAALPRQIEHPQYPAVGYFTDAEPTGLVHHGTTDSPYPYRDGRYVVRYDHTIDSANTGSLTGMATGDGFPVAQLNGNGLWASQNVQNSPYTFFLIPEGDYVLSLTQVAGGRSVSKPVHVTAGATTVVDISLDGPTAGVVGTVRSESGAPIGGATVSGDCSTGSTTTDAAGAYTLAIPAGGCRLRGSPPAGYRPGTGSVTADPDQNTVLDFTLAAVTPIPDGASLSLSRSGSDGVPVVSYSQPLTLRRTACPGGTLTYTMSVQGSPMSSASLTETPPGSGDFVAIVPPASPQFGAGVITVDAVCPGGGSSSITFDVYIDPSGTILDTSGNPVENATVTLLRGDSADGPFTAVPDGSTVMSPGNRTNPWTTGPDGTFGWDVMAGYYRLDVTKSGCHAPGEPSQPVISSPVWAIPPEVVGVELTIECPLAQAVPTVEVTSVESIVRVGAPATLRATVSGPNGPATGTVGFSLNGSPVPQCQAQPVVDGAATCPLTPSVAGSTTISADYSGDLGYSPGSAQSTVRVRKGFQRIIVGPLGNATVADGRTTVTAVGAATQMPLTATSATPRVCSISSQTGTPGLAVNLDLRSAGICRLRVNQPGDANWWGADTVDVALAVNVTPPRGPVLEGAVTGPRRRPAHRRVDHLGRLHRRRTRGGEGMEGERAGRPHPPGRDAEMAALPDLLHRAGQRRPGRRGLRPVADRRRPAGRLLDADGGHPDERAGHRVTATAHRWGLAGGRGGTARRTAAPDR